MKVSNNEARLGRFDSSRYENEKTKWLDGREVNELKAEREALKKHKKELKQELGKDKEEQRVAQASLFDFGGRTEVKPSLKWLLSEVERKDDELYFKWKALSSEKQAHIRASKRVKSEDSSNLRIGQKVRCIFFLFIFNLFTSCLIFTYQNPLCQLQNKYVLVHVLGSGGSSEV